MTVRFFVEGVPVPQGSKTGYVRGGRVVLVDANASRLKPWRAVVAAAARAVGVDMLTGPVRVRLDFVLPRPQRPKWDVPAVKPDLDKLTRAVFDGVVDGGLLRDDSLVVDAGLSKRYGEPAGVWVWMEGVGE